MAKTVLSTDELALLMEAYESCGTYSGAARLCGLSVSVATRIIKEQKEHQASIIPTVKEYNGPRPVEMPDKELVRNFWNPSKEWENNYGNYAKSVC